MPFCTIMHISMCNAHFLRKGITMIKSMTGFGRGESQSQLGKITVEIRSVNHRYLDLNIRMPRKLNPLESNIRNEIKRSVTRGKMDVYINYEDFAEDNVKLQYNASIAKEYATYIMEMEKELGIPQDISTMKIATLPEVFVMSQADEDVDELWSLLGEALKNALDGFVKQRIAEGSELKADLDEKLDHITKLVETVETKYPSILEDYKSRLYAKLKETLADTNVDESRIAQEMVIYADKCCVDEETVRLKSHVLQIKNTMNSDTDVGKKLDFLVQEMNREANTTGSKAQNIDITKTVIGIKSEIEKIREQIQNIE